MGCAQLSARLQYSTQAIETERLGFVFKVAQELFTIQLVEGCNCLSQRPHLVPRQLIDNKRKDGRMSIEDEFAGLFFLQVAE